MASWGALVFFARLFGVFLKMPWRNILDLSTSGVLLPLLAVFQLVAMVPVVSVTSNKHTSSSLLIPFSQVNLNSSAFADLVGEETIFIAALIPDDRDEGLLMSFRLALKEVAESNVLPPNVRLKMVFAVTKCLPANTTKDMFDLLHFLPQTFVLFGTGCRGLTGPISQISFFWNVTMVSYSDTNPELDSLKYHNFVRVIPSDADFNLPRIALFQALNWTKCSTVYEDSSRGLNTPGTSQHAAASAHLDDLMKKVGNDQSRTHDVKISSFPSALLGLERLKKQDYRIISAMLDVSLLSSLFCAAYQLEMFGDKHVWILSGFRASQDTWSETNFNCTGSVCNCTYMDLLQALNYSIHVDFLNFNSLNISELKSNQKDYMLHFENQRLPWKKDAYHQYAYDSVKVVAQATKALLGESTSAIKNMRTLQFQDYLNSTNIDGITGGIRFRAKSRLGVLVLHQILVEGVLDSAAPAINFNFLDTFDCSTKIFTEDIIGKIKWKSGKPPKDRTVVETSLVTVYLPVFTLFCALAGIGLMLSIIVISINIKFRFHRYIKMSSPRMNNLIVAGCVLCYVSIVLLGLDSGVLSQDSKAFTYICSTRAWVLSIGFTLSFGAMFSKTWRVHCIFTNISMNKKIIKDYQLMLIVVLLLFIDFTILIIWMIVDPLRKEKKVNVKKLSNDRELHLYCEICVSQKQSLWLGLLFAYKGLLLLIGCFFAWETRHVNIPALNDSKYIGMSVYNVLVMCLSGAAVSFAVPPELPNAAFAIQSLLIFFCTTITLGLVFFPKLIELRRDPKGEEKRVRATIKKISKRHEADADTNYTSTIARLTEENNEIRRELEHKQREVDILEKQKMTQDVENKANETSLNSSQSSDYGFSESKSNNIHTTASKDMEKVIQKSRQREVQFKSISNDSLKNTKVTEDKIWVKRNSYRRKTESPNRYVSEEELFDQSIAELQEKLLKPSNKRSRGLVE